MASETKTEELVFVRTCAKDLKWQAVPCHDDASPETSMRAGINAMGYVPNDMVTASWSEDTRTSFARSGLLGAILYAYNSHSRLVLSPDAVWQTVLTQVGLYMNANAEAMRSKWVAHEGKKKLVVYLQPSAFDKSAASAFLGKMSTSILENLNSDLEWLMPDFSTTGETERLSAAVALMAATKNYFEFMGIMMCGIPEVALTGTVADWEALADKVARLKHFGGEASFDSFVARLGEVAAGLLNTKKGAPDYAFWDRIVSKEPLGSGGQVQYNGWFSVFMTFNEHGEAWEKKTYLATNIAVAPFTLDKNGVETDMSVVAGCFGFEVQPHGERTVMDPDTIDEDNSVANEEYYETVRPVPMWAVTKRLEEVRDSDSDFSSCCDS